MDLSALQRNEWVKAQTEKKTGVKPSQDVSASDALKYGTKNHALLLTIHFKNFPAINITNCAHDITLNAVRYKSSGDILKISPYKIRTTVGTSGIKLSLAGEIKEYIDGIVTNSTCDEYGTVNIDSAFLDDDGNVITTVRACNGFIDKPKLEKTLSNLKTDIEIIPPFIKLDRAIGTFKAALLQKIKSPDDTIFQYMSKTGIS